MVGKRVQKKRMRAPAVLVLLAAMAVVLTTAGPRSVAADSPLQSPVEPVLEQQPEDEPYRRRPERRRRRTSLRQSRKSNPLPLYRRAGRWRIHILMIPLFWEIPGPRASSCTAD